MSMFEKDRKFRMDGVMYEHTDHLPDPTAQTVRRFTYGKEPKVIAQVPLADGSTMEVHCYAVFWTREEVDVAWTDDRGSEYSCWVPASQVRRAAGDEWHGRYLPR